MAKFFTIAALFAAALCFSSFLISVSAGNYLFVEGMVYCDVCRVEFETPISPPIAGAKVQLDCRSRENGTLSYSLDATTDDKGKYSLAVEGDHEEDICEVRLLKSPREDCNEPFRSADVARVLVSKNDGMLEPVRFANALGFMQKEVNPECPKVLEAMGFLPN